MDYEDVVNELRYLRKGEGFTFYRLYDTVDIPALLGSKELDFYALREKFLAAVQEVPGVHTQQTLLAAFGLLRDYDGYLTVRDRREKFSREVNRKYDALLRLENAGIDYLANLLLRLPQPPDDP